MADNKKFVPENLDKSSVNLLNSLLGSSKTATSATLLQLDYLKSSLSQYKDSLEKSTHLKIEFMDLMSKYQRENPIGSYNLPGVSNLGLNNSSRELIEDNKRMTQIKAEKEVLDKNTKILYSMLVSNYQSLLQQFQAISKADQGLDEFIENAMSKLMD